MKASTTTEPESNGVLFETVFMYALMASFAVFTTIVGAILLRLVAEFGLPLSRGGDFVAAQNAGCFVGVLASGFLIDRYRRHPLALACFVLFAATLVAMFFSSTLTACLALLALAGLSSKILDALLNASISRLHPINKGFYMNLLHCCFGAGSFIGPLYAGAVVERWGAWRLSYLGLGCLCFVLALAYAAFFLQRRGAAKGTRGDAGNTPEAAAPFATLADRPTITCMLVLFIYCAHQLGVNNWLPAFMSENTGSDPVTAGFGLSVFWLGLIAGRLACSFLTRYIGEKTLVVIGNAVAGLAIMSGVARGGETAAFAAAATAGFFSGATIPMILTLAYTWHPRAQGKVSMLMFLAITAGGAVGPWAMGKMVTPDNLGPAMYTNGCLLLVTAAIALRLPGRGK